MILGRRTIIPVVSKGGEKVKNKEKLKNRQKDIKSCVILQKIKKVIWTQKHSTPLHAVVIDKKIKM